MIISNHVMTLNACCLSLMLKSVQVLLCETTVDLASIDQNNPPCGNSAGEVPHFYYRASVTSQTRRHGGPEGSEGLVCSFT